MTTKIIIVLVLISAQALADDFSSKIDILKKISDNACLAAFYMGKNSDPNDPRMIKCAHESSKITKKILDAVALSNASPSDKMSGRAQAFLTATLCKEFMSPVRQFACFRGAIANSPSGDLNRLDQYALKTSENYLLNQNPIYIFVNQNRHTDTGEKIFEIRYAWWIQGLLRDYAKTPNPDADLIINKHPDILPQKAL